MDRADAYPFLFVNHGPLDLEAVGKCEEVFLWFRAPVPPDVRARIAQSCPSPLNYFWHWDREFCYFGSQGDTYDSTVVADYTPEPERTKLLGADPRRDAKGWMATWRAAQERFDEAVEAFAADVERWVRGVHAIAPIAVFWGPNGAPEDDPWHRWSCARFSEVMYERLAGYAPDRGGREYLGWVKNRCEALLVRPPPREKRAAALGARDGDDARAAAVLDEASRRNRPRAYVPRLSYPEHHVLEQGEQVARFVGKGKGWSSRLERLAPLTQLTFLASYDVDHRKAREAYPDLPARVRTLVEALPADEQDSAVPLLVMLAQTLTRDTPAFDRARRADGGLAARVLRAGFDRPGCSAATYARAARYLRWGRRPAEARALAEQGLARFGERRVLLRAGARAARAQGDAEASARYLARLEAVAAKG